jgi:triphosphatase
MDSGPHVEREMKFRLPEDADPASLREIVESAGYRLEAAGTVAHTDQYLDTEDWALYRGGLALRLRSEDDRVRLEAKTLGSSRDGTLTRHEWAQESPAGDPPWVALPDGPVASLLRSLAGMGVIERLAVRAVVRNERECFRWMKDDSVVGSMTVDHVSVPPSGFREVELELANGTGGNGSASPLGVVGRAVEERLGIRPAVETKMAAALAARGERLPEPEEMRHALSPADRLLDVAHKTFARHFSRLAWNEPGTRLGVDPEYLHDMRVATRRLRTSLEVLAEGFPEAVREEFETDLRWLGGRLGRVRDLDVMTERIVRMSEEAAAFERPALRVFAQALAIRRARRRMRLVERLDSARYREFMIKARGWIDAGPPAGVLVPEGVMAAYTAAPRITGRWMAAMNEAFEKAYRSMDIEDLHALRIAAKKARYSHEYFADLEGPAALRRAKRIAALQDYLGKHLDTSILARLLRRYTRSIPPEDSELVLGAGSALGQLERETRLRRGSLREHWERATAAD